MRSLLLGISLLLAIEPAALAATETLVVTPTSLEPLLFHGSTDIAKEMNNVLRAKNNVEVAFGNLIPSLNLSVGAIVVNPPLFLLSSVSCLVPFLFPSSWYGFDASKKDALAEIAALEITKLNAYASAYSLLVRFSNDEAVLAVLREQYSRLDEFARELRQKADGGGAPRIDSLRADFELKRMDLDLSRIEETLAVERAAIRKMLGLSVDQEYRVELGAQEPPRLEEVRPTQLLVDRLVARAPERRQLELLIQSGERREKAAFWAFLAGCAGSQGAWGPTTSNAFTFSTSFSVSIGYGNFPQVSLTKRNLADLRIREQELGLEFSRLLESTQSSVVAVKRRLDDAAQAVVLGESILSEQTRLAADGKATRKDLLDTANSIARAKVELLNAKAALEGHRVTLRRLAVEGKFLEMALSTRKKFAVQDKQLRRGD